MSTSVSYNGTTYSIPAAGESSWSALSSFLIDLANSGQTKNTQSAAVRTATSTPVTVAAATDFTVITNLTVAGAVAVTLPAGVNKQMFIVIDGKGDGATNNITVSGTGGQTIAGAATYVIATDRGAAYFQWSTTENTWQVINSIGSTNGIQGWVTKTTTYTAVNRDRIFADSSGGTFTITLPASPILGTSVDFRDPEGTWATNNVTVARNSSNINGVAANYTLNIANDWVTFTYYDSTIGWVATSQTRPALATATLAGLVSTSQQSFGGLKKLEGGLAQVGSIDATDANVTLTNASARDITFTSFTASRDVTLPTTSILSGEVFILRNTTALDMVVKASNGSALTIANSANFDATVRSGYVVLISLQAIPTTPAHWLVMQVRETYTHTTTWTFNSAGGTSASVTIVLTRVNNVVHGDFGYFSGSSSSSDRATTDTVLVTRFRPTTAKDCVAIVSNNGAYDVPGMVTINTSGAVEVFKDGGRANYTNGTSGLATTSGNRTLLSWTT